MSTDGVPIYSFRLGAGHCMHASHVFPMALHAGSISVSNQLFFFFCCVRALQHHQALSAFSLGSEFPKSGKLPVSPSRIHDKHKHLYPRRFFRALLFAFLGQHRKASRISGYALETWDHGSTALSKHYFHNCSVFFLFFMYRSSACCFFIAKPSIAAGCADYFCFGGPG